MTDNLTTDAMMEEALTLAGFAGARYMPGPNPLASPSCKALESASVFAEIPSGAVFLKVMHPEMREGFDLHAAMTLAKDAGRAGIGPEVTWSDTRLGAIAMYALTPTVGWRTAKQYDLQSADVVASIMTSIRSLQETTSLDTRFEPFHQIDAVLARAGREKVPLPSDTGGLRRYISQIEPLSETATLAPCRNDGVASNVMIGDGNAIRLVDYDRAGLNDPFYDVGTFLAEVSEFEADMRAGFVAYYGRYDAALFARAMLWSYVDDLLHVLSAFVMAKVSARRSIEWIKYAEWRLMRLRMALSHPQFEEKLRVSGASK